VFFSGLFACVPNIDAFYIILRTNLQRRLGHFIYNVIFVHLLAHFRTNLFKKCIYISLNISYFLACSNSPFFFLQIVPIAKASINLALRGYKCRAFVNTVMNLQVP